MKGVSQVSKKRMVALLLSLVLVFSVVAAACGGNQNAGNTGGTGGGTQTGDTAGDENKPLDKVTFRIFNGVAGEKDVNTNETVIGKITRGSDRGQLLYRAPGR